MTEALLLLCMLGNAFARGFLACQLFGPDR